MNKTDCLQKRTVKLKEPITNGNEILSHINVPCGNCSRCLQRRKMEWSFRMEQEREESKTAYFVTLTYDPEHLPYQTSYRYDKKGRMKKHQPIIYKHRLGTLNPIDLTNFFKRLRKLQSNKKQEPTHEHLFNNLKPGDKLSYYAAGEYGEARGRPHYHAIIYNASRKHIEKAWGMGNVHIMKADEGTIMYVMKYLDKQLDKKQTKTREPEYNTMSEGIGKKWLEKNSRWHRQNIDVLYVTNKKGMRIPMPKYYRLEIFTETERKEQVKIVTTRLEEIRQEEIKLHGLENYNEQILMAKRFGDKKFKKKIKKRVIE